MISNRSSVPGSTPYMGRPRSASLYSVINERSLASECCPIIIEMHFQYWRLFHISTFQWRPPVALGHPHLTTRPIHYQGMVIPSGAYLHLNAWAIQHDSRRHDKPDEFIPERYEDDTTTVSVYLLSTAKVWYQLDTLLFLPNDPSPSLFPPQVSAKHKLQRRHETRSFRFRCRSSDMSWLPCCRTKLCSDVDAFIMDFQYRCRRRNAIAAFRW